MKTHLKRIILLILSLSMVLALSCVNDRGAPVMTLGNATVTDHMYEYWVCSYKAVLFSQYSDASDTDEFWDMTLGDTTAEAFFYDLIFSYIESNLVSMYLFDEFALEIKDEDRETAKSIIDDLKESYAGGNANDFNRLLANYGVNADLLYEIYLEELKSTYVYNHVFESGILTVGDEEKEEYLEDNYVRIRQIFINNKYDSDLSDYDENGDFKMVPLDDEVQAAKDAKVKAVTEALDAGEDFDTVYEQYSEETAYPNGYYLSLTLEGLPRELINRAFALDVGETDSFETEYGTHFIMRLEMNEKAYEDDANADFFKDFKERVYEYVFDNYVRSYYDRIVTDDEAIANYSVRSALPNYSFQY